MHIGKPPKPIAPTVSGHPPHTGFVQPFAAYLVVVAATVIAHGVGAAYGISLFGGQAASWLSAAGP